MFIHVKSMMSRKKNIPMFYRIYIYMYVYIIERSLAVKLPTIWTDGKAEVGRFREEKRNSQEKEDAGA